MLTPKDQLKEGLLWAIVRRSWLWGPRVRWLVTWPLLSNWLPPFSVPSGTPAYEINGVVCTQGMSSLLSENALADMSRAMSSWCSSSVRLTVRISNHSQFLRVACNPSSLQPERKSCLNNENFWCALLGLTYFYFLFFWCFVLLLAMLEIKSPILGKCWTTELHPNTSVLTFREIK